MMRSFLQLSVVFLLVLTLSGCGKKGALKYPAQTEQHDDVARQGGQMSQEDSQGSETRRFVLDPLLF